MFALSRPAAALRRLVGATPSSRLPRRTVRLRLTALYGCLFLLSGAGLLVITNLLVAHQSTGAAFYISRGNGRVETHIQGVVGSFSAPVGLPAVAVQTNKADANGVSGGSAESEATSKAATSAVPRGGAAQGGGVPQGAQSGAAQGGGSAQGAQSGSAQGAEGGSAQSGGSAESEAGLIRTEPQESAKIPANATPQQLRAQARQLTVLAGKQRTTEQSHLLVISAIALGFMAVISLALGWLISGRALRPLDEAFEAQRRFVANASHELRTPLAMMRTSLDVAVAKPGARPSQLEALERKLREGLDQADGLVESFLTLARAQSGAPSEQRPVSLTHVLRASIESHAGAAAERGVEVCAAIADDVLVAGSETLVRRMVDNVIDNAIRHNEPGGWVRVSIAGAGDGHGSQRREGGREAHDDGRRGARRGAGRRIRVVVENGGPRLSEDDVAALAQPFRRLGTERTGSQDGHGVGLSIVTAIAAAHEGVLRLRARAEGGLRVVIELPAGVSASAGAPA